MTRFNDPRLVLLICLATATGIASASDAPGPRAEWNFDDTVTIDTATRVEDGDGFALSLDGMDDYVDGGDSRALGVGGPVTIEAWVKPTRKANGEAVLFGETYSTYVMTYYNTELCLFYIGSGGNNVRGKLALDQWNHVVATFDGQYLTMWVNGRLTGRRESQFKSYEPASHFIMGTRGSPALPRFKGMLDRVRVYDRALDAEQAVAHFKSEAGGYGFDTTWFDRVKVTPYYYFDRGQIVIQADYQGLQPLAGDTRLQATLVSTEPSRKTIARHVLEPAPESGKAEVVLSTGELAAGNCAIEVLLEDERGPRPVERLTFAYPAKPSPVPAPDEHVVGSLPTPAPTTLFSVNVGAGGGFEVTVNGKAYPFESRISWPNGAFNRLATGANANIHGEPAWTSRMTDSGDNWYEINAGGEHYTIHRRIDVLPTHVNVKDTYTNITNDDVGLLIYNQTPIDDSELTGSWLSGHEQRGRQPELAVPDYGPTVFFTDANTGMGIVAMDDVYFVQAVPYVAWQDAAGVTTEKFALAAGNSYTVEWAVYPTGSRDYYDFINTVRHAEDRIGTMTEAPGFITQSPENRRQVPDQLFIDMRGLTCGIIHSLSFPIDDPQVSIEGIEFMDFPREMQLLRAQASAIHRLHPDFKVVFHIAHSLYATNQPDRFADSKVILADGHQSLWGGAGYITKQRQDEGWQWWIYYPTPGNSFHDAMMRSVDVIMDDLGMDGVFMDGFLSGYTSQWTYDRWDGHSAEIDPKTHTIRRKIGSVILLSQPSMIAFARKVRDKGGSVIANNSVYTRSITNEKYIIFNNECASGPQTHLAPTVIALAAPPFDSEQAVYLDMLDKLRWGELFLYYGEGLDLTYPSLASWTFPITFEEIRRGMVRGPERIVTMNSGVYGWPDDRNLHLVHKFDQRGAPVRHDFVTTVDSGSVRTQVTLNENESAVIEPVALTIDSVDPLNVRVSQYDGRSARLLLSGRGDVTLQMFVGAGYPTDIGAGAQYEVTIADKTATIVEIDGLLSIGAQLDGPCEIQIVPAAAPTSLK